MAAIGKSNMSRVRTMGSVGQRDIRITKTVEQMTNKKKKSSGGAGG